MSHGTTIPAGSFEASITAIRQETPAIKSFWLDYGEAPCGFKAGQWIDLFVHIDGQWRVGGYSMTSSPLQRGRLQLAVKYSDRHPVTRYLHEQARVGGRVRISAGQGSFYFERGMARELVLLGAGIGVTPLISIFRYVAEAAPETRATLVYSASEPGEFLFRAELEALADQYEHLRCLFTVTRPHAAWGGVRGRIDRGLLEALGVGPEALYYYCGSREFIEAMTSMLGEGGVESQRLRYEPWW